MTELTPIAGKLANIIRRLGSDRDGEIVAAVHAMRRVLQGIGADLHCLAERVEQPGGELSEADMQRIFDAGRAAERQAQHARNGSGNGAQMPPPREMALYCYQYLDQLSSDWENEFILNMESLTRTPTPLSRKQQAHLQEIYIRLRGKI